MTTNSYDPAGRAARMRAGGLPRRHRECKVARQYWPDSLEVLSELPKTPSGTIRKLVLREQAKAFSQAA